MREDSLPSQPLVQFKFYPCRRRSFSELRNLKNLLPKVSGSISARAVCRKNAKTVLQSMKRNKDVFLAKSEQTILPATNHQQD